LKNPGISVEDGADASGKRVLKAVNGISFSLKKQESFALLGVNGAGKSTTFKMLTLNEVVSKGTMKIDEHTIEDLYNNQ
jgi:ABC-type multidrug transport system ATPase subunit